MDCEILEFLALNNDVVLDMIFGLLNAADLLRCRKVSQKWNQGATSILKRRPVYMKTITGKASQFHELFQLMRSSQDFPFTGIRITFNGQRQECTVDTSYARKFFQAFGHSFKHLYLDCQSIRSEDLAKLLSFFLPNLRTIELGQFSIQAAGEGERVHKTLTDFSLPTLRRIKVRPRGGESLDFPAIQEADMTALLRAATGLDAIEGCGLRTDRWNEGILRAICATNHCNKFYGLTLEYNADVNVGLYQSLALHAPSSLTQLTLDAAWKAGRVRTEFFGCVRAVLLSSAETLRILVIGRVTFPFHQLLATFPKLTKLEFQHNTRRNVGCPGFSSHYDKFPALQEIRFGFAVSAADTLRKNFWGDDGTVWRSVVKLGFGRDASPEGMKHLVNIFPAVKHVIVDFEEFFGKSNHWSLAFSALSELTSLENLEIVDITQEGVSRFHLDEFLTGMPQNICRMLRNRPKLQQLSEDWSQVLRQFGGILKLKGTRLKKLVLHIYRESNYYPGWGNSLISKVSVWYGLEMIPGLRTVVTVPSDTNAYEIIAATFSEQVKLFITVVNLVSGP